MKPSLVAAQRVSGTLGFETCSSTNTATVRLTLPGRPAFVLRARRERGYPVLRGALTADGRLVLSAIGTMILILDTGAQASVIGPESAHMLIRRRPPPPDLRLFGAGDARLLVIEMGTLVIAFAPSANPHAEFAALPRRAIQLVRAQTGFRVGMVSRRPSQVDRPAPGRGRRAEPAPVPARGLPASETALPPGISVTDAAARLGYFDRPTFAAFQETTSGLRLARARASLPSTSSTQLASTAPSRRRLRDWKASLSADAPKWEQRRGCRRASPSLTFRGTRRRDRARVNLRFWLSSRRVTSGLIPWRGWGARILSS